MLTKKKFSQFNLLFKRIFIINKNQKFNLKRIKHFCWEEHSFSSKVSFLCKNLLQNLKIKNFIINYEGVPFQTNFNDIKKINYKIKTRGYLHCAPWPLQSDLIYKDQYLDNLVVSGIQQKYVLKKFLGWKKKKISVIPSLRFKKTNKREFNGYLFVPYKLDKEKDYLERLEKFLKEKKITNKISVRVHPLNQRSKQHIKFKKQCNQILSKHLTKKLSLKSKYSLFFGSATGVCIQALEEGTSIIHFPNNEEIDVFSNKFWPSLKIKRIGDKIFEYKIIKKIKCFLLKMKMRNLKIFLTIT